MFTDDETLARTDLIGTLAHEAIATLIPVTRTPTVPQLKRAASAGRQNFGAVEGLAHRQTIAGLVGAYFWQLLPSDEWTLVGAEQQLGPGRVDLLWTDPERRLLIDEIKTGHVRTLTLQNTRTQVDTYIRTANALWGNRFAGLRLLSLQEPWASKFIAPDGATTPLTSARS
jgi:hypothetical protein